MTILLSPLICIFSNLACITALILLRIAIASTTKIDATPRLNAGAWMNLASQLRIMKPPAAPSHVLDPSKLILMNPP